MIPASMTFGLLAVTTLLMAIPMFFGPKPNRPMYLALWSMAVGLVLALTFSDNLWMVALLGFVQNIAFTFVSRGRNSSSLFYHMIASLFSNGIYAVLLFTSVDQITSAKQNPGLFVAVYTLATMGGSIFAHWLALRAEKGKARVVTEDRFEKTIRQQADRIQVLEMAMLLLLPREEQRQPFSGTDYADMKATLINNFDQGGGNPFLTLGKDEHDLRTCDCVGCGIKSRAW